MWNSPKRCKAVGIGLISALIVGLVIIAGLLAQRHWNSKGDELVSIETDLRTADENHSIKDSAVPEAIAVGAAPVEDASEDSNIGLLTASGHDQPEDVVEEARQDQELALEVVLSEYAQVITDWYNAPPGDPKEMIRFALQMHEIGRFGDAELLLTSIQSLYPDQPATYEALGEVYMRLGEYEKAIGQFAALREMLPQAIEPVLRLTDAQIEAGYIEDALAELRAAIAEHPLQQTLQLQAMRALDHIDDYQALSFVQDWVACEPENTDARQILATQYISCGFGEEALKELDYLVQSNPELVNSHIYSAIVLENLGLTEQALAAHEQAVVLAPHNPDIRLGLAQLLLEDGQQAKAAEQVQEAIDLMPENSEREPAIEQLGLAQLLTEEGQQAEAAEQIQVAIDLMPENSGTEPDVEQLGLAQRLTKEDQSTKVDEQIQPAVDELPEDSGTEPDLE